MRYLIANNNIIDQLVRSVCNENEVEERVFFEGIIRFVQIRLWFFQSKSN